MSTTQAAHQTAEDCLAQAGWNRHESRPGLWFGRTRAGSASLTGHAVSSDWHAWFLTGGAISPPAPRDLLRENARLPGLCKFVDRPGATPACRFDLPLELLRTMEEAEPAAGPLAAQHPLQAWAAAVTAAATGGSASSAQPAPSAAELAAWLEKAGWPASTAAEDVRVNVTLPGLFRQMRIERNGPSGARLSCELAEIAPSPAVCRTAALSVAEAANQRLRLARFVVVADEHGEKLYVEINLSPAQIPGVWLGVALEAMHVAIRLTSRELTALRDPELAKWTLAASAA